MTDELTVRVGEGGVDVAEQIEETREKQEHRNETNKYLVINGSGKKRCSLGGICLGDGECLYCKIASFYNNHK